MKQRIVMQGAGRIYGRLNTTTARGNLLIRRAFAALLELIYAGAAEDGMSVRVNKPGQNNLTVRIYDFGIAVD